MSNSGTIEISQEHANQGYSTIYLFFLFFAWLPSYLPETEEPPSLWGTIKRSAHCCAAIINVALHRLPLVAHVRRMNRQCTQSQPFSSARADNCPSHFCQIEANLPDVLRCPQKTPGFHLLQAIHKLLFVASSSVARGLDFFFVFVVQPSVVLGHLTTA